MASLTPLGRVPPACFVGEVVGPAVEHLGHTAFIQAAGSASPTSRWLHTPEKDGGKSVPLVNETVDGVPSGII